MYTLEHKLQEQAFINVGLPTNYSLGADAMGRLLHTLSGCGSAGGAGIPCALGYGGSAAGHSSLLVVFVGDFFYPPSLKGLSACGSRWCWESLSVFLAAGRKRAGTRGPHSCL